MKDCLVAHSTWEPFLLVRQANVLWWRASSEGFIDDCTEISQMTIKLRFLTILDSSARLVASITQLNGKSATRNSELETDGVTCILVTPD